MGKTPLDLARDRRAKKLVALLEEAGPPAAPRPDARKAPRARSRG